MGKIIMNGNTYGSMGSNVEANPTGAASDTLNTIGIDDVVYEIQGGGGSSSGAYIEETLWEGSSSSSAWVSPITLNIDVNNYDFIIIKISVSEHIISVKEIPIGTSNYISVGGFVSDDGDYERRIWINRDTNTLRIYTGTGTEIIVTKVVGIKTSGDYFSPIIYSTEEREVGVWIDNKPLYQKTFVGSYTLNGDSWRNTGESITNGGVCIKCEAVKTDSNSSDSVCVWGEIDASDGHIEIFNPRNAGSVTANQFTIWYTKTTDTAGSGSYNTLGVPTVHYSTDESIFEISSR